MLIASVNTVDNNKVVGNKEKSDILFECKTINKISIENNMFIPIKISNIITEKGIIINKIIKITANAGNDVISLINLSLILLIIFSHIIYISDWSINKC